MAVVADSATTAAAPAARPWLAATRLPAAIALVSSGLLAAVRSGRVADSHLMLAIAVGTAIVLVVAAARTPYSTSASWLAVLLIGAAATLELVNAGTSLHYQHFVPWPDLLTTHRLVTSLLLAQALLVIRGFAGRWMQVIAWWRHSLGLLRGTLLVAAMVLSSAALSVNVADYAREVVLASILQFLALGTVVLAVWALPVPLEPRLVARVRTWWARDSANADRQIDTVAAGCAIAVTVVTALLSAVVYERHPHVQDEVKYLYQARYFAAGQLAMAPPPVARAFELYLMEVGHRGWYSVVPPGWPLVLAAGEWLGAAWLINPVLSGANVLLAFVLFSRLFDRQTARAMTVLLSASPWNLYLGMSFMPHTLTLTCTLLAALGVLRARQARTAWPAWAAGASLGLLSLVRQLDGLVVAVLLGLWAIGCGGSRLRVSAIAGLVGGTIAVGALVLPYNWYFTGSPTAFPIMVHNDRLFGVNSNAYGFGPDRGMGWPLDPFPGHGPVDAMVNAALNTTTMNTELFGWATGSLLLAYFLVLGGHARTNDWLFVALAVGVFVAYFFNYFSGGPDFGARYWFLMILSGVALTVRGAQALGASFGALDAAERRVRVGAALAVLTTVSLIVFVPWRAGDKYYRYLAMSPEVVRLSQQYGFGRSLILVRGEEFPDYASAAIYNPLDLSADAPIYAHDRDAATRADLLRAYADRPVWIIEGPSLTHAGYKVVAGPLDPMVAAHRTETP